MTSSKHQNKELKPNEDNEMENLLAEVEDKDKLPNQPVFDYRYDYYAVKKLFEQGKDITKYLA